jgi:predicted phage tail protein
MQIEGFRELVTKNWKQPCPRGKAIEVWQVKIRRLRKFPKGWSININDEHKKKKQALVA